MYKVLLESHSGFRYVVLILLIAALLVSYAGWFGGRNYTANTRRLNLFAMVSAHIQFLLGLILYFVSPLVNFNMGVSMKNATLRYWTVEHIVIMLIAIVLITIGHSKSKKITPTAAKHRTIAIFYSLAFIIIIVGIIMSQRPLIDFMQ